MQHNTLDLTLAIDHKVYIYNNLIYCIRKNLIQVTK
jgi:hypothetical protein